MEMTSVSLRKLLYRKAGLQGDPSAAGIQKCTFRNVLLNSPCSANSPCFGLEGREALLPCRGLRTILLGRQLGQRKI